jgi:hypothetical protein
MRIVQFTIFLMLVLVAAISAEPGYHLKAGDALPHIEESDQTGQLREFRELLGPNGAVLVVFRSADW